MAEFDKYISMASHKPEVSIKKRIGCLQSLTVVMSPVIASKRMFHNLQLVTVKSDNLEYPAVVWIDKKTKCNYTLLDNGCIPNDLKGARISLTDGYNVLFAQSVSFTLTADAKMPFIVNEPSTDLIINVTLKNIDLNNFTKFLKSELITKDLIVKVGMTFKLEYLTQYFYFVVTNIIPCFYDSSVANMSNIGYRCFSQTEIEVIELHNDVSSPGSHFGFSSFGGYKNEIDDLRNHLDQLFAMENNAARTSGILISGSSGVGKSLIGNILECIYKEKCLKYSSEDIISSYKGEAELNLRKIFQRANARSPSVIFIDDIDEISSSRDGGGNIGVVTALLNLMDGVTESQSNAVMVVATATHPEILDAALRRPGRLSHDITLSIPSESDRLSILNILLESKPLEYLPIDLATMLASKSPGYTAGDLKSVVSEAFSLMPEEEEFPSQELFVKALDTVKPSSLKNIKIQTYKVLWDDIHGYENLKSSLLECFQVTLNHKKLFDEAGISAPSRFLLIGPPGCGKSMVVNALANHFSLAVITIKRSNVFGKYFGESEKNLALLFEKAQKSSPCILHFENFDGIAGRKQKNTETSSDAEGRIINYLKVMLDGVVGYENIFVMAETNRPDLLDKNVIRQGRFHQYLFFDIPSKEDRRVMIENAFKYPVEDLAMETLIVGSEGYTMSEIKVLCDEMEKISDISLQKSNFLHVSPENIVEAFENVAPNVSSKMIKRYRDFAAIYC